MHCKLYTNVFVGKSFATEHKMSFLFCRTRFLVLNYADKFEEAMAKLAELVLSGKIKVQFFLE